MSDSNADRAMHLFNLKPRVAIVTGGSEGIGRAISLGLAAAGANIAVVARHRATIDSVVEEIGQLGCRALGIVADVREPEQVARMIDETLSEFGRLDILVNNVGGSFSAEFARGPLLDLSEADFLEAIRLNVMTVFHCSRAAALRMKDAGAGNIVNIASMGGRGPNGVGFSAYSASKAAVIGLTYAMALEWAPSIRVNAVAPGHIDTPRTKLRRTRQQITRHLATIAMNRYGEPEDIAGAVVYLASDASAWTTGTVLDIHGGATHW